MHGIAAGTGQRTQTNRANLTILIALYPRRKPCHFAFVEHVNPRHGTRVDFFQHRLHGLDLHREFRVAGVDHMQQQISLDRFLQRGAKRGDQAVREVANEADGVREHDGLRAFDMNAAQRGVERCEQLIGGVDLLPRQAVEERRFARVGVTHQRDIARGAPLPGAALRRALGRDLGLARLEGLDPCAKQLTVGLQLGLAGPALPDSAALALEVRPAANQPGRHMFELRQFDLQFTLGALGAQREYVQYQGNAVDHPALERTFEVALLGAGQRVVENDQLRTGFATQGGNFFGSCPNPRTTPRPVAADGR